MGVACGRAIRSYACRPYTNVIKLCSEKHFGRLIPNPLEKGLKIKGRSLKSSPLEGMWEGLRRLGEASNRLMQRNYSL